MHLHLANCHGEWLAVAALVAHAAVVRVWLRAKFNRRGSANVQGTTPAKPS